MSKKRWQQSTETRRVAVCAQPRCCRDAHSNGRSFLAPVTTDKFTDVFSAIHINTGSARVTPFSTHSKLPVPQDFPKPRCQKDHICPAKAANAPRGLKSLSCCASLKDLYSIWTGMCFRDNLIPPLHSHPTFRAARATPTCCLGRGREKVL